MDKHICPPDHRHGVTSTCYNSHRCRCEPCRTFRRDERTDYDYRDRLMRGRDVWVSATGTIRRLQGLAGMGWSAREVAVRGGFHPRAVMKMRDGHQRFVKRSTAISVDRIFRQLAITSRDSREGRITRTRALQSGWVSPFAWDHIDNPRERPKGVAA